MTNSKLIQLLKTFSKEEFKSFGKFVRSPFFYKDKAVINLYDSLKPFYPDFHDKQFTKEFVFRKIYPGKAYNDSLMKYLMSEMLGMAKKFLAYTNFENDSFERDIRLLKELNNRNTTKIFESQLKRLQGRVQNYQVRNQEYFNQMYRLKELVNDYYSYKDRLSPRREQNKIIENIINNFLISLLNSYYEISNDLAEFRVNIDLNLVNYIEDFIKANEEMVDPVVIIYYHMFMLAHKENDLHYFELLELKQKYLQILDDDGKHRIFEALGNYCISRYQSGGIKYYREAFNIINDEIKHGVRFNRKEFSEIFFTNKIEIASKVKEFEWARVFIEKYKDRLNSEHRRDIVNFCYAIIEFETGNYRASLNFLSKINLHHPLLRFRIRNYTLLNYYELNYIEQSYSLIDTYKHMLAKDRKLGQNRKDRYSAFVNSYNGVLDLKVNYDETEKGLLKKNVEASSVFMKHWLLEKIEETGRTRAKSVKF
jgi:hypothetical protein